MGTVYCGPYAEQVGFEHEGYAARVLLDGSLTGSWTAETADFVGHVAACGCGWTGGTQYPPTDAGEDEARAEWDRGHLQPLIEQAKRGWPAWAERVSVRAREVSGHVADGQPASAVLVLDRLVEDVAVWSRIARELADGDG
jgi:hypothetical protein